MLISQYAEADNHVEVELPRLEVPPGSFGKEEVDKLVTEFKAGPGRLAKGAICCRCRNEGRKCVLNITKPSSLKRHLYPHFGIKCYGCLLCGNKTVTEEQSIVHSISTNQIGY
ncbi:hypothetical protein OPQ81_012000 [Rhizoctonia solani]|nr:hypothetical protein OPQ81_012000 [Rhizoctonia solani]